MTGKRQLARFAAAALAVSMVAAACGSKADKESSKTTTSESKSGSTTTEATGPQTTRGVTDTSIKIGGLIAVNGFFKDSVDGAQARFNRANDEGGVNGRTIDYIGFEDDNSEANKDIDAVRKLAQQDEVFAVVPALTPALAGDLFTQLKVPFFGWGISPSWQDNEYGFGFTGSLTPDKPKVASPAWGLLLDKYVGGAKDKTLAIVADDSDLGRSGITTQSATVEAVGFEVVAADATVPTPPTPVGDYTPFANAALTSNGGKAPDVILLLTSFQNTLPLSKKLVELGYEGVITNAIGYDPSLVSTVTGQAVYLQYAPPEQKTAANVQLDKDVQAFKPGAKYTQALLAGYWSADLFIALLEKTGKDLSVEKMLATANGGDFTYEVAETVGKSEWPKMHTEGIPCGSLVVSNGNAYEAKVPYLCGAPIKLK